MGRLKIMYVSSGLNIGGAEMLLSHMLAHTDRARFAPSVVSLGGPGRVGAQIVARDVSLYSLNMPAGRPSLSGVIGLARAARTIQPDIIQGWMYHGNLAAQLAGLLARVPVIWCVHKSISSLDDEKPATAAVIRLSARLSGLPARIVYVSEAGRAQHERLGFRAEKSLVISNGIDAELFRPSESARHELRAELGLATDTLLIGLIARYHPQKDFPTFLRAAAALAEIHPAVHFVLAGTRAEASNAELAALLEEHGLTPRVHLLGERDDIPWISAGLDIVSSSSAFGEGLSLALAEAMAAGVPCVVTDIGDSAMLVGDTGKVAPPRDPAALCSAWAELIALGPVRRRALGAAARERVLKHFSIDAMLGRYEQLYSAVLGDSPGGALSPRQESAL